MTRPLVRPDRDGPVGRYGPGWGEGMAMATNRRRCSAPFELWREPVPRIRELRRRVRALRQRMKLRAVRRRNSLEIRLYEWLGKRIFSVSKCMSYGGYDERRGQPRLCNKPRWHTDSHTYDWFPDQVGGDR